MVKLSIIFIEKKTKRLKSSDRWWVVFAEKIIIIFILGILLSRL